MGQLVYLDRTLQRAVSWWGGITLVQELGLRFILDKIPQRLNHVNIQNNSENIYMRACCYPGLPNTDMNTRVTAFQELSDYGGRPTF